MGGVFVYCTRLDTGALRNHGGIRRKSAAVAGDVGRIEVIYCSVEESVTMRVCLCYDVLDESAKALSETQKRHLQLFPPSSVGIVLHLVQLKKWCVTTYVHFMKGKYFAILSR